MNAESMQNGMDRRDFLRRSLAVALVGSGWQILACSSDSGSGPGNGGGSCTNPKTGVVDALAGHSHSIDPVCQQDVGSPLTLTLTGNGHTHTISLTAPQIDSILAGSSLSVDSTNNSSHIHAVQFN